MTKAAKSRQQRRTERDAAVIRRAQAKKRRAAWQALPPKCRRAVLRWMREKADLYVSYPIDQSFVAAVRAAADFMEGS